MSVRTPIKVYFTAEERDLIDAVAERQCVSRGQLIRDSALSSATNATRPSPAPVRLRAVPLDQGAPTLALYTAAVDRAARVASGIPRPHLEAVVAAVVNTLVEHRRRDKELPSDCVPLSA